MRCRFYCCLCCYYTTARVNAAQIFAVGVCVAMPLMLLVLLLHYGEGKRCSIFPVGVGAAFPFILLLVLLLHYGEGKCCSNFRRWCRRCVDVFTAVGAAITLRRGQMLHKYSPLVYALRCCFTAVDAAITLRRRRMQPKFSPLVWALPCRFQLC